MSNHNEHRSTKSESNSRLISSASSFNISDESSVNLRIRKEIFETDVESGSPRSNSPTNQTQSKELIRTLGSNADDIPSESGSKCPIHHGYTQPLRSKTLLRKDKKKNSRQILSKSSETSSEKSNNSTDVKCYKKFFSKKSQSSSKLKSPETISGKSVRINSDVNIENKSEPFPRNNSTLMFASPSILTKTSIKRSGGRQQDEKFEIRFSLPEENIQTNDIASEETTRGGHRYSTARVRRRISKLRSTFNNSRAMHSRSLIQKLPINVELMKLVNSSTSDSSFEIPNDIKSKLQEHEINFIEHPCPIFGYVDGNENKIDQLQSDSYLLPKTLIKMDPIVEEHETEKISISSETIKSTRKKSNSCLTNRCFPHTSTKHSVIKQSHKFVINKQSFKNTNLIGAERSKIISVNKDGLDAMFPPSSFSRGMAPFSILNHKFNIGGMDNISNRSSFFKSKMSLVTDGSLLSDNSTRPPLISYVGKFNVRHSDVGKTSDNSVKFRKINSDSNVITTKSTTAITVKEGNSFSDSSESDTSEHNTIVDSDENLSITSNFIIENSNPKTSGKGQLTPDTIEESLPAPNFVDTKASTSTNLVLDENLIRENPRSTFSSENLLNTVEYTYSSVTGGYTLEKTNISKELATKQICSPKSSLNNLNSEVSETVNKDQITINMVTSSFDNPFAEETSSVQNTVAKVKSCISKDTCLSKLSWWRPASITSKEVSFTFSDIKEISGSDNNISLDSKENNEIIKEHKESAIERSVPLLDDICDPLEASNSDHNTYIIKRLSNKSSSDTFSSTHPRLTSSDNSDEVFSPKQFVRKNKEKILLERINFKRRTFFKQNYFNKDDATFKKNRSKELYALRKKKPKPRKYKLYNNQHDSSSYESTSAAFYCFTPSDVSTSIESDKNIDLNIAEGFTKMFDMTKTRQNTTVVSNTELHIFENPNLNRLKENYLKYRHTLFHSNRIRRNIGTELITPLRNVQSEICISKKHKIVHDLKSISLSKIEAVLNIFSTKFSNKSITKNESQKRLGSQLQITNPTTFSTQKVLFVNKSSQTTDSLQSIPQKVSAHGKHGSKIRIDPEKSSKLVLNEKIKDSGTNSSHHIKFPFELSIDDIMQRTWEWIKNVEHPEKMYDSSESTAESEEARRYDSCSLANPVISMNRNYSLMNVESFLLTLPRQCESLEEMQRQLRGLLNKNKIKQNDTISLRSEESPQVFIENEQSIDNDCFLSDAMMYFNSPEHMKQIFKKKKLSKPTPVKTLTIKIPPSNWDIYESLVKTDRERDNVEVPTANTGEQNGNPCCLVKMKKALSNLFSNRRRN